MPSANARPAAAMQAVRSTGNRSRPKPIAASAKAQSKPAVIEGMSTLKSKVSSQTIGARMRAEVPA